MPTSRKLLVFLSALLLAAPASTFAGTKPLNWINLPTRTVLLACQDAHSKEPRVRAVGRTICESLVSAYVDGFMRGAVYGNGKALIHDPKALLTVEGVEDLNRRLDALDVRNVCSKEVFNIDEVVSQWSVRVYSSETLDQDLTAPYTTSLYALISDHFCHYK